MIKRTLAKRLEKAALDFPVITLTGPRQSGKTTLVKSVFSHYKYVSLEAPDERDFAVQDPRGFLGRFAGPVILDECQRAPELFSYIQVIVDERDKPGQYVLTGSQNFLLLQSISQSLAGRAAIFHLLPFSLSELLGRGSIKPESMGKSLPRRAPPPGLDLMDTLFRGFYPRIHDKGLAPMEWLANYYITYLERDVRNVLNVGDLETFGRFIRLCAGRNGQLLNLAGLASDCGITHTTAKRWISVLEASFIISLLRPHHRNFGKRMVKSPKLYFLDTGLLCYLLGIQSSNDIHIHSSRGSIFESFVISEFIKNYIHRAERPGIYFWRDSAGREVDLIIESGEMLIPVEIKSGQTIALDFFNGLKYWLQLSGNTETPAALVYGGNETQRRGPIAVYPWFVI